MSPLRQRLYKEIYETCFSKLVMTSLIWVGMAMDMKQEMRALFFVLLCLYRNV